MAVGLKCRTGRAEVDPDIPIISVVPHMEQLGANFRLERLMARLTAKALRAE